MIIQRAGFELMMLQTLMTRLNDDNNVFNVHLFTNPINPDRLAGIEQFTEPGVAGYLPFHIGDTFGVPYLNPANIGQTDGTQAVTFAFDGPGLPITVYGYFIDNEDATDWAWAERCYGESGLVVSVPGTVLTLLPRFVYNDYRPPVT